MSSTKDRLTELQLIQNGNRNTNSYETLHPTKNATKIDQILLEVETIREHIESINYNTEKANYILANNVFTITKGQQDELDSYFSRNTYTAQTISNELKIFENDLKKARDEHSTEYRIKNVQLMSLKYQYQEALKESSACLEFHKIKRRELLSKSLKATSHNINEEELETLLDENKLEIFTDNILINTEEAKLQLLELEDRHKQLLKIEKHLNEILDLFIKVGTLIDQQQESIDRVEYHASAATDYIERGTGDLEKGANLKKKSSKTKIYIILIIMLALLIILLIIFAK